MTMAPATSQAIANFNNADNIRGNYAESKLRRGDRLNLAHID
jgi:hypothetical protein